jgi:hypothetical protein
MSSSLPRAISDSFGCVIPIRAAASRCSGPSPQSTFEFEWQASP